MLTKFDRTTELSRKGKSRDEISKILEKEYKKKIQEEKK